MCKFHKFYICAVVGVMIEELDNMHGVTMKISKIRIFSTTVKSVLL